MFFKNLQYALRNLWRDKFYTFLNGTGLAIGMAAALLIFLWANDELSYDNFHAEGDRIYRVNATWTFSGNAEKIGFYALTPGGCSKGRSGRSGADYPSSKHLGCCF